ncbi:protein pitchfork-like [Mizuhopecten yessoensis]|uniref:Protein pitchfork n=1 Tax=Mizuhopecten yessoensis TaxID=6573 RepID=A0A210R1C3_MIZYE|nr:protein pitchfork-like [Mizuhopecten yessoensis]OWF54757.1 Protein pitchfork [Mizuhopecten yessoensis]
MEVETKKPKVGFMTTMDREMFPTKMPYNRFGNEIAPLRGAPHRGPGCYENEDKTSFMYNIENKINSKKGYTLGARTAARIPSGHVFETPCPTEYQTHCTEAKQFVDDKKPFLVGAERFPIYKRDIVDVLPGAGTYEHQIPKNRKVQWHQSFGGTPIMLPDITIRSTIDQNTEKLYSTKEEKKYHRKLAYLKLYWEKGQ